MAPQVNLSSLMENPLEVMGEQVVLDGHLLLDGQDQNLLATRVAQLTSQVDELRIQMANIQAQLQRHMTRQENERSLWRREKLRLESLIRSQQENRQGKIPDWLHRKVMQERARKLKSLKDGRRGAESTSEPESARRSGNKQGHVPVAPAKIVLRRYFDHKELFAQNESCFAALPLRMPRLKMPDANSSNSEEETEQPPMSRVEQQQQQYEQKTKRRIKFEQYMSKEGKATDFMPSGSGSYRMLSESEEE